jgi:hypothetical protein
MTTPEPLTDDVARLICGNIEDLRCYLNGLTDQDLVRRAIAGCERFRESKTKLVMLQRHLRRLEKGKS